MLDDRSPHQNAATVQRTALKKARIRMTLACSSVHTLTSVKAIKIESGRICKDNFTLMSSSVSDILLAPKKPSITEVDFVSEEGVQQDVTDGFQTDVSNSALSLD